MIEWSALLPFLATVLIIELTPGPNMFWLIVISANYGKRAGYAATLGIALGLACLALLAALGVGHWLQGSPAAMTTLRWLGVGFLGFLAWEAWRDAGESSPARTGDHQTTVRPFFQRGLIVNLLNVKAALFFVTVLPGFTPEGVELANALFWLASTYVAIATVIHLILVSTGQKIGDALAARPTAKMVFQRVSALLLFLMMLWVLAKLL